MGGKGGRVKKMMGTTEEGWPDTPKKMSNVKLSRLVHGKERGCAWCFPHGLETNNSTRSKNRRSWKTSRTTQYRPKKASNGA